MDHIVLIIDDDKIIRKITSQMVKICKLSLSSPLLFENGLEAFSYLALEENKKNRYILFLDINMPVMDGWTFLRKMEEENLMEDKTIYLFTSSVDKGDHQKGLNNSNVKEIITKPLTLEKLRELIKTF